MIPLKSTPYKVIEIKAKTKAHFFEKVVVGDILEFEMEVEHTGRASRGGTYASDVLITNVTTGKRVWKTQSQLTNILSRSFAIEPCEEN